MLKQTAIAVSVLAILGACAEQQEAAAPAVDRSAPAPSANIAQNAAIATKGLFAGQNDHKTFGTASIGQTSYGMVVILGDDFRFDGSANPRVGLGNNGYASEVAALASYKGRQVYAIPASINLDDVNEVWIWDADAKKGLGVAKLIKG